MPNTLECVSGYEEGVRTGDLSIVPFANNVSFNGPILEQPIKGKEAVIGFLTEAAKQMSNFHIKQHIIQGEHACTLIEFEAGDTTIEACDYFRVSEGKISEVRVFFDSRLLPQE